MQSWSLEATKAVKKLKKLCQNLLPLNILGASQLIFQVDVSDKYWAYVLIEECEGSREICGYKFRYFSSA